MGIFGKKKAAAAPAAAPDPLAEVSMTLSRLAHAVEALDAGVPPLLEQLAQQLSAVGSAVMVAAASPKIERSNTLAEQSAQCTRPQHRHYKPTAWAVSIAYTIWACHVRKRRTWWRRRVNRVKPR